MLATLFFDGVRQVVRRAAAPTGQLKAIEALNPRRKQAQRGFSVADLRPGSNDFIALSAMMRIFGASCGGEANM